MKILRYIMCALLPVSLLAASPAGAVDKTKLPAVKAFSLSRLQEKYKKTASLEADFTQEVYQATLGRTKTSQGSIKLGKPNLVRWEIAEPEASIMVSNGRKVFYFTPDARGKGKGQVIERNAAELARQPLFRILSGNASLAEEFKVTTEAEKGIAPASAYNHLKLVPKKPMGDLAEARLKVDSKYLIQEVILETQSGNKTKITLQNQALGAKLPAQLFEFKPPEGTEVIRN